MKMDGSALDVTRDVEQGRKRQREIQIEGRMERYFLMLFLFLKESNYLSTCIERYSLHIKSRMSENCVMVTHSFKELLSNSRSISFQNTTCDTECSRTQPLALKSKPQYQTRSTIVYPACDPFRILKNVITSRCWLLRKSVYNIVPYSYIVIPRIRTHSDY